MLLVLLSVCILIVINYAIGVVVSTESTEEIMQLFGNYHQLSEILKEKANATGRVAFGKG